MPRAQDEQGIALITAMLVMLLTSSLLVGFAVTVTSDQRLRTIDRQRTQAFYAAHSGLEKLTADLGNLFSTTYTPTLGQVNAVLDEPPALPGMTYAGQEEEAGYEIDFPMDVNGNPIAENRTIASGPYQGFVGLVTPYTMAVTAHAVGGAEVRMTRTLQTVGIPVFQFGMFSENDLSFFAGPDFNFGGRVHSNGNLFLAESTNRTLTLSDRVTAVGEVIRTHLSNGWSALGRNGTVNVLTAPGSYRHLAQNEGSLIGTLESAENEPSWTNLSIGTYNGHIRNGRTGAYRLDLPLVRDGATPIDIIRRPDPAFPDPATVLGQRYFRMASLRILLSDTAADITTLPTVTPTPPVDLTDLAASGYTVDATHPPIARAGPMAEGYRVPAGIALVTGFLKVEKQRPDGTFDDVTLEILNLGIAGRNLSNGTLDTPDTNVCTGFEPNPTAVVRLQHVRDVPTNFVPCGVSGGGTVSPAPTDYWPNVLYDPREGNLRDSIARSTQTVFFGGLMHYVELDVANLSQWMQGEGADIMQETGYVVYFSDRRGNRNLANQGTGEYGFEDFVNPASAPGTPNGILDTGEDVNADGTQDVYGQTPIVPLGATAPLDGAATPTTAITRPEGRVNPPIFFRRALKVVNGRRGNVIAPGFAVVAENPIYVQGDYNAITAEGVPATYNNAHVASSIIADSVTLLSNAWNDIRSFTDPHRPAGRQATSTTYRTAVISGKGLSFPRPTGFSTPEDFGTDGGTHNFLRYIERWSGQDLNYRGSIVSLYTNRQGIGVYKCCRNVYSPPRRNFVFDTDFLQPSLLPPRTPMFRDVNTTGFSQVIAPTPTQ